MMILKNLEKLAEKISHTYDLQWEQLDTKFGRNILEDTYADSIKLIPEIEQYIQEAYGDKDFDWNIDEDDASVPYGMSDLEAKITQDNAVTFLHFLSDSKVSLLYELYTVRYLYARVKAIDNVMDAVRE